MDVRQKYILTMQMAENTVEHSVSQNNGSVLFNVDGGEPGDFPSRGTHRNSAELWKVSSPAYVRHISNSKV